MHIMCEVMSSKGIHRGVEIFIGDIVTKFGMVVDMESLQRAVTLLLTCSKIQDGSRPPF